MDKLTVLIVDDHPVFRHGLELSLKTLPNIGSVFQASNGIAALELLQSRSVDLVFLDIKMPEMNGIEMTERIRKMGSQVKIVALSMFDDRSNILKMFQRGASGYLSKNSSIDEIEKSIQEVLAGNIYLSNQIHNNIGLIELKVYSRPKRDSLVIVESLNTRERDILKLICQEYSNSGIATILKVSVKTVEGYKTTLYHKIGCKNMVGLVKYALENNYIILNS